MEKKYTVHRSGWKKGGTLHWFSRPLVQKDANVLAQAWKNPQYIPKNEECSHEPARVRLEMLESVVLEEYKKPADFADGKMRRVTVGDRAYFYQTITGDRGERITTIYDLRKNAIYKYNGDPHDCQPSGVKRTIRDNRL
ncbi:hypothetical protein HY486_03195 [Candidatus Woesearchaeota archaeon]|nr:hypothetical protein [Candidatus Woesearchaeota archaeon]